jgi:hypothetical protein
MSGWIRFQRYWELGASLTLFDKINFYVGRAEAWGIGIKIGFYDRSITFEILNLYFGMEIYHKAEKDG